MCLRLYNDKPPVAQEIEQRTSNSKVVGANPTRGTRYNVYMKKCKKCSYYGDNFDKHRLVCKECRRKEVRQNHYDRGKEKNYTRNRKNALQRKYGISIEEYESLKLKQNNLCAICNKKDTQPLSVDHDHSTGEIRGLLCNRCNQGLGFFKDNIENLRNAERYLIKNGKKSKERR